MVSRAASWSKPYLLVLIVCHLIGLFHARRWPDDLIHAARRLLVFDKGANYASFNATDTLTRVFPFRSSTPSFMAHNVCVNPMDKTVTFYAPSMAVVAHAERLAQLERVDRIVFGYRPIVSAATMPTSIAAVDDPVWLAILDFDNANPYHWAMRLFFLFGSRFDTCTSRFYTTHPAPSLWQRQTLAHIMQSCQADNSNSKALPFDTVSMHVLNQHVCFRQAFIPGAAGHGSWFGATPGSRFAFVEASLGHAFPPLTTDSNPLRVSILQRAHNRRFSNIDGLIHLLQTANVQGRAVNVTVIEFEHNATLAHTASVMANTDILVGTHGAGLTHSVFLPPCGGLLEVQLFNAYRPHYKRLTVENDLFYEQVEPAHNPFPEQHVCGGAQHGQGSHVPPCEYDAHVWTLAEVLEYDEGEMRQAFERLASRVVECRNEAKRKK